MATKGNDPCLEKAKADEPLFTLLARDKTAPILVKLWAELRELEEGPTDKVLEAFECAQQMELWREKNAV